MQKWEKLFLGFIILAFTILVCIVYSESYILHQMIQSNITMGQEVRKAEETLGQKEKELAIVSTFTLDNYYENLFWKRLLLPDTSSQDKSKKNRVNPSPSPILTPTPPLSSSL